MIYTVGHSTLSEPDFEKLIAPLDVLMDVRSHPGSKWPQFRKEHLESWIPKLGKRYVWEPRLGGWDRRHLPLADEFAPRGVDIPVYARGKFPKQRISAKTGDTDMIREQLLRGCSCGIGPDILEGILLAAATDRSWQSFVSDPSNASSLRRLYDLLLERIRALPRSTGKSRHNAEDKQPLLPHIGSGPSVSAFRRSPAAGCISQLVPTGISCTPSGGILQPSGTNLADEEIRTFGTPVPSCPDCTKPTVVLRWNNVGLYDYSWFMSLDEFVSGAADLVELGRTANVGIMCCEVLWWKCHRSMVADYLVRLGEDPVHLQPKLKRHAESIGNRLDRYDPLIVRTWPEAP